MSDQEWETIPFEGYWHIRPKGDQIRHELTDTCVCGPDARVHQCSHHRDTWFVLHHALDGRQWSPEMTDIR